MTGAGGAPDPLGKDQGTALQDKGVLVSTVDAHALGGSLPFRAVYDREFPVVVRVLRRLGVQERQLEDAAQEVFAVVLRRRGDFDARRPVRPWLCGIATRVAADFRKRVSTALEVPHGETPDHGDDRTTRQVDARPLLLRALDVLSRDERVAVLLVDLEGQSAVEVALALGIPSGTLYARLHDARKKLTAHLTRLTEAS